MRNLWYAMACIYLYFMVVSMVYLNKTGAAISALAVIASGILTMRSNR